MYRVASLLALDLACTPAQPGDGDSSGTQGDASSGTTASETTTADEVAPDRGGHVPACPSVTQPTFSAHGPPATEPRGRLGALYFADRPRPMQGIPVDAETLLGHDHSLDANAVMYAYADRGGPQGRSVARQCTLARRHRRHHHRQHVLLPVLGPRLLQPRRRAPGLPRPYDTPSTPHPTDRPRIICKDRLVGDTRDDRHTAWVALGEKGRHERSEFFGDFAEFCWRSEVRQADIPRGEPSFHTGTKSPANATS